MKRITLVLADDEAAAHATLSRVRTDFRAEAVWNFWRRIAEKYSLRSDSLICEGTRVTGLPLGSTKHWCWPFPLKCDRKAVYHER